MLRTFPILAACWVLVMTTETQAEDAAKSGVQVPQSAELTVGKGDEARTATLRYLLYLPKDYGKKKQSWPLMLFLHGAGERGDDLEKVKIHGPPMIVEKEMKDLPFVIISPQCPKEELWATESRAAELMALVDQIAGKYTVDQQRMYITGLSMGGYGAWRLGSAYPQRFAAVLPICGGGDVEWADALTKMPIWAFHGDKDSAVSLEKQQVIVDAVNKVGGAAKLTIYPGVGHNSWAQTYANPEIYEWLLSHQLKEK